jgi:hypothetical protein
MDWFDQTLRDLLTQAIAHVDAEIERRKLRPNEPLGDLKRLSAAAHEALRRTHIRVDCAVESAVAERAYILTTTSKALQCALVPSLDPAAQTVVAKEVIAFARCIYAVELASAYKEAPR